MTVTLTVTLTRVGSAYRHSKIDLTLTLIISWPFEPISLVYRLGTVGLAVPSRSRNPLKPRSIPGSSLNKLFSNPNLNPNPIPAATLMREPRFLDVMLALASNSLSCRDMSL